MTSASQRTMFYQRRAGRITRSGTLADDDSRRVADIYRPLAPLACIATQMRRRRLKQLQRRSVERGRRHRCRRALLRAARPQG